MDQLDSLSEIFVRDEDYRYVDNTASSNPASPSVINQSEENGCLNTWHLQARGSGGGKPDNVELVREVEGLIAGMALLEELDPSRDDGEKWSRTDPEIELIHDHLNNHFRPCGNMGGCGYLRCKENFLSVYDPYNLGIRCDTASIQEHLVSCTEWKHEGPLRVRELSAKLETVLEEGRLAELISACDAADEAVKHRIPSIAEFCDNFWIARDSNRIAVACSGADCNPTVTERGRIQENRWEVVCHYLFKHNFVVSEEDKDALVLQLQSGKTRATIDSEIRRMSFVPAEVVSALETTNDPQFGLRPQSLNDLQVQTKHATSREQIMTLRSFRRRLLLLHRRILNIAGTSKKPGLRLLGKTFSRFSSFANCGFLSLRETLEKCPPSSLDEVLAFTSITLTMRDTLRILGQHPGLKTGLDLSTWVHAISGDSAQSNFIDMGKRLWPDESFDNLEAMKDISRLASSSRLASPSRLMTSPSRLMTSFSRLSILELLLRYKPELGMRDMKNAASQVLAGSANSDSPFRNFLDMSRMEDLADAFRYECSAPHRGTADGDQGCGKSEPSTRRATAEDLAASSLVLVAIEFLIFISTLGIFLLSLAASRNTAAPAASGAFTATAHGGFARFVEVAKFGVLLPMSEDATMKKFHPILRVAVMLVENGLIHTVRHLEDYLARVGKVFSESFADYSSFITTAARSCLAVSEDPRLDYTRIYDTAVESQLYSEEYVVSKIFEEELDYMVTSLQDEESARAPDYQIPAASTILPECREAHPDPFLGAPDLVTEQNDIFDFISSHLPELTTPALPVLAPAPPPPSDPAATPDSAESGPATLQCSIGGCARSFAGGNATNSLARHRREKHSGRDAFACPAARCGHESRRKHNLRVHWQTKHPRLEMPEGLSSCVRRGVRSRKGKH